MMRWCQLNGGFKKPPNPQKVVEQELHIISGDVHIDLTISMLE
jgi:hypothetical protein